MQNLAKGGVEDTCSIGWDIFQGETVNSKDVASLSTIFQHQFYLLVTGVRVDLKLDKSMFPNLENRQKIGHNLVTKHNLPSTIAYQSEISLNYKHFKI